MGRLSRRVLALGVAVALVAPVSAAPATAADNGPRVVVSAKKAATIKVKASKKRIVRGKRAKYRISVKGGKGRVVVYDRKKRLRSVKLSNGKAVYRTPKKFKRGLHKLRFVHQRTGSVKRARLVVQSKSKLNVSVSERTFSREGQPALLTATVRADKKPVAGVLTVSEGTTVVAQARAHKGKASVRLPEKLSQGAHAFTVTFKPAGKYVRAPKEKTVRVSVTSDAAFAGDGMFIVGVDINPGLYVSRGNDYCYWARLSDFSGTIEANDGGDGDRYIRIKPTDKVIETSSCEDFVPAPSTRAPRNSIPGDGYYRIGYDLAPGIYRSDDATDNYCYWARLADATGDSADLIANDGGRGRRIVQVEPTDAFLEVSSCGTWTKIG